MSSGRQQVQQLHTEDAGNETLHGEHAVELKEAIVVGQKLLCRHYAGAPMDYEQFVNIKVDRALPVDKDTSDERREQAKEAQERQVVFARVDPPTESYTDRTGKSGRDKWKRLPLPKHRVIVYDPQPNNYDKLSSDLLDNSLFNHCYNCHDNSVFSGITKPSIFCNRVLTQEKNDTALTLHLEGTELQGMVEKVAQRSLFSDGPWTLTTQNDTLSNLNSTRA